MKNVKSIGHVAISVRDIDRSLDFYVRQLGFAEMFRLEREGRLWIVYLRVTDTQFVELFPDATGERAPPFAAVGFNHLCLEVDDMTAALEELTGRGVKLTQQRKTGVDHNDQAWIEDPDGNRIELMQLSPKALQLEAIRRLAQTR
jgi:lactoylglutathione lyase